jgi:hypothetical protein
MYPPQHPLSSPCSFQTQTRETPALSTHHQRHHFNIHSKCDNTDTYHALTNISSFIPNSLTSHQNVFSNNVALKKKKTVPITAMKAYRVVRCQASHIIYTDGGYVTSNRYWPRFLPRKILSYSYLFHTRTMR